jgi:putative DNA primase/helicase
MSMTIVELLSAHSINLTSTEPGRYYTTCPKCSRKRSRAHQANKVLGVTIEDDGGVHWGCNHCGWTGPEKGNGGGESLQTYVYRDTNGEPRFRKVRNLPGREPKFWLEQPDGRGGWTKGTKGVDTKILYRFDEVTKAIKEGRPIAIAEGEKDVDSLCALGFTATCNAHGASEPGKQAKWWKVHSEQLTGADTIIVFNDNDAAGYAHADTTCRLSVGIVKRVLRLDLASHWPNMSKGADVSDWLARGHTREELEALIESAPDYTPSSEPPKPEAAQEPATDPDVEITRLAKLSPVQYEQQRIQSGEKLGVRASILDRLVRDARKRLGLTNDGKQGQAITFLVIEPWPEPVAGAALLDALAQAIRSHVVMSDHARDTCALFVVHSYLLDHSHITPRLAIRSPVKRCGKTTLIDVLARLVWRPLETASATASGVFRTIAAYRPTLLIDEAAFLRDNDDLRRVLHSGHRVGGAALLTVGEDHEPRHFATYAAVVIALIGNLNDELADRSVSIDLKRRLAGEEVTPFRLDRTDHLDALARQTARWAQDHGQRVGTTDPQMPAGLFNRDADNWRPLLAIADVAGGEWSARARKAALAAHAVGGGDDASRLELLLGDIRDIFAATKADKITAAGEITSAGLVERLIKLDGRPWAEMGKGRKPLTQNRLARMLNPLSIRPEKVGPEEKRVGGYKRERFEDAFARYLAPQGVSQPDIRAECDEMGASDICQPDSPTSGCPVTKCEKSNNDGLLSECLVAKGGNGAHAPVDPEYQDDELPENNPEISSSAPPRCAHCGSALGTLNEWDRDGRPVHLHQECEEPWLDRETGRAGNGVTPGKMTDAGGGRRNEQRPPPASEPPSFRVVRIRCRGPALYLQRRTI